jgi:hypothetical protein
MATAITSGFDFCGSTRSKSSSLIVKERRRQITAEAGRALELLGHAIEYLSDELVHEGKSVSAHDPQVQAIQILMAINRQVYYACPTVPTLTERIRAFLHVKSSVRIR